MRILAASVLALITAAAWAAPRAELSTTSIDLGVIEQGKVVDVPLSVRNTGAAPLTIKSIKFSCHCVSARALTPEERVVPPGGEQLLPIRYDPKNYTGQRQAIIAVTTDDPDQPFLEARVTTTIVAPVVMTPRMLRWGPTVKGTTLESTIRLKPGVPGEALELLSIDVPSPALEFTKIVSEENGEIAVAAEFRVTESAPIGELNSVVEAQVRLGERQFPVRVPLSLYVMGDAAVRPPQIVSVNRPVAAGEQISTITLLWTQPDRPIELLDVTTEGPIRAERRALPDRFEVDVFAADDTPAGPNAAQVTLFSTSADAPVSSVPVYFLGGAAVHADPPSVVLDAPASEARVQLRTRQARDVPNVSAVAATGVSAERVEGEPGAIRVWYDGDKSALPATGEVTVELEGSAAIRIPVVVRDATGGIP